MTESNNKKIIYFLKDITEIGGREVITLKKANFLAKNNYDVYICSFLNQNKSLQSIYPHINFINLNIIKQEKRKHTTILLQKMQDVVDNINPTKIIFLYEPEFKIFSKVKAKNAKKIIEIHGKYEFYIKNMKLNNIKKYFKQKITNIKFKLRLKKFDYVILLSKEDQNKWNLSNSLVIPNFIKEVTKKNITSCNNKFISAGRLSHEKGFDILVKIWKEVTNTLPNAIIDIYGEGDEYQNIIKLIHDYNLEKNVIVHKFSKDLDLILPEYFYYIQPSRFEAFPMIILESMSNGLPIIGFDIGSGFSELVTNDKEGYLAKPYNITQLANFIIYATQHPEKRSNQSQNVLNKASLYTEAKIMTKWINLLQ